MSLTPTLTGWLLHIGFVHSWEETSNRQPKSLENCSARVRTLPQSSSPADRSRRVGRTSLNTLKNASSLKKNQQRWFDYVREKAYNHPRHVRTIVYSDRWLQEWSCDPTLPYPRFPQWRQAADDFIEKFSMNSKESSRGVI